MIHHRKTTPQHYKVLWILSLIYWALSEIRYPGTQGDQYKILTRRKWEKNAKSITHCFQHWMMLLHDRAMKQNTENRGVRISEDGSQVPVHWCPPLTSSPYSKNSKQTVIARCTHIHRCRIIRHFVYTWN